jgi:hypothetical protein
MIGIGILVILLLIIIIFDVNFTEGHDGYYIIWYRRYESFDGIKKVKYSKRVIKFKEQ